MTDEPTVVLPEHAPEGDEEVVHRLSGLVAWLRKYQVQAIGLVLGAVVWEIAGRAGVSPAFPAISAVFREGVELWASQRFIDVLKNTATSIGIAFPPSLVVGVLLGLLMGLFRPFEWVCRPYINLALSLPLVAIIPIVLLIFGLSQTTIVVVIILYVLPVVMVNTFAGVRSADADLMQMAESFNAGRALTLKRIILPAARPLTLAGIRIGVGRAISGGIVAEQVVGVLGIGGLVQRLGGAFAVESLYAVIIFIGAVGVASLALVNRIEQRYQREGA
ncbi:MAG TPA: ABC transporter permease subunit [Acidimicrobiia bacterium]|nr:ABC transporter permease subunit [Acidimicrobiia bacterium]